MSFMSQSSAPDGAEAQPTLLDIVMQALDVTGRSAMDKAELAEAVAQAEASADEDAASEDQDGE